MAGLFQETLRATHIPRIALLNIDADWYESVKLCLETFYDAVAPGGIVSIDDYGLWPGCRQAVDEFIKERQPAVRMAVVSRLRAAFARE